MKIRLVPVIVTAGLLSGCAFLPWFHGGMDITVAESSRYCGTESPDAALHYFASPGDFAVWIRRRHIRNFRTGAASLGGVLVVEMGRRPSAGYAMTLDRSLSTIKSHTLVLRVDWKSPDINSQVAQVIVSPCMAIVPPPGDYDTVVLRDQNGALRGKVSVP